MSRPSILPLLSSILSLLLPLPARAAWPSRTLAPYLYVGSDDPVNLTASQQSTGLQYFTLAFIIAQQQGHAPHATYSPTPAWDGRLPLDNSPYLDQITSLRQHHGDVIISFGGEAGRELAQLIDDPNQLQQTYQSILDRYHFTWLDFDIEGNNLTKFPKSNQTRNAALAQLQRSNPDLRISYTLPADPRGLSPASLALLKDAHEKGLHVYTANLMVMYFGKQYIHKGKSEAQLAIDSAQTAHTQLQQIDPAIKIGLTPCLGPNGSPDELFTPNDARALLAFAQKTPWIASLHYWSLNDDAHPHPPKSRPPTTAPITLPGPYTFAKIFLPFSPP